MNAGRAHALQIDGIRVHSVEWKPERTGPEPTSRVLLVHGLGANTISWSPVGQLLADRLDASVTAIDLVGFGRTRALDRPATLVTNRALVQGLLDERGPAMIIGNSMGAAIGAGVAARRPELVEALVLVDPALPWGRLGPSDLLRLARMARLAPLMMPSLGRRAVATRARMVGPERLVDLTLDICIADRSRLDPNVRQQLVHLAAERYAYPEAAGAYADAARSLFRELASGATDRDLATASRRCPALVVHGEEDRLVRADLARAAVDRHPALDLEVLEGVGHAPQLEVPERLVEVVVTWLDARMGTCLGEAQPEGRATVSASSVSPSGPSSTT